jgi:uncharacterized protein (TIGR02246 family)
MAIYKEKGPEMEIREIARENFARWAEALLMKDPKKVAELYAEDCTFLPTLSTEFMRGPEKARGYFEHFLEKSPRGEIRDEEVQPMGKLHYSHNGLYDFEVDKDGNRIVMECRFTYNWRKEPDEKWKLIHHHSSEQPKKGK